MTKSGNGEADALVRIWRDAVLSKEAVSNVKLPRKTLEDGRTVESATVEEFINPSPARPLAMLHVQHADFIKHDLLFGGWRRKHS